MNRCEGRNHRDAVQPMEARRPELSLALAVVDGQGAPTDSSRWLACDHERCRTLGSDRQSPHRAGVARRLRSADSRAGPSSRAPGRSQASSRSLRWCWASSGRQVGRRRRPRQGTRRLGHRPQRPAHGPRHRERRPGRGAGRSGYGHGRPHRRERHTDDLQAKVDELDTEVATLTLQIRAAENEPTTGVSARDYAPAASLDLGRGFGENADPPLTDDEATCLGASIIDRVGIDFLFVDLMNTEGGPSDEQFARLGVAGLRAADECGIPLDRLRVN